MRNLTIPFLRTVICLPILAFALFITSCGEDDQQSKNEKITFNIPETAIAPSTDVWFFVTDANGKVLLLQEAFGGVKTVITLPEKYAKPFALHKLTYVTESEYTEFRIQSTTNAFPGDFSLPPIVMPEVGEASFHNLILTDVPAGSDIRVTGPNASYISSAFPSAPNTLTIKATLKATSSNKLMYYVSGGEDRSQLPRYTIFTDAQAGDTETISYNDMTPAESVILNLGENASFASVTITPTSFSNLEFFTMQNTDVVPLYYPGNAFDSYTTEVATYEGNSTYRYNTIGAIPNQMKKLSVTMNSFSSDEQKFEINTTGSFDYLYAYSGTEWTTGPITHYIDWLVYMNDEAGTFIIPEFPAELIARYPELANKTVEFDYLNIVDSNRFTGYKEFVNNLLNPPLSNNESSSERVSLAVDMEPAGSRKRLEKIQSDLQ
jgi:hypothetical protein